ncbi:MAG: hypothetical protein GY749_22895 [Desulfobacteraceae bacterium]|nr:hypothetical protein [Desulfobacteraceae bacterium]
MDRHIDEFEIETGFIINTDLQVEFDYYGCGQCDIEFGDIWTLAADYKTKPVTWTKGIRIDENPAYAAIVEAVKKQVLNDLDSIHDEWMTITRGRHDG